MIDKIKHIFNSHIYAISLYSRQIAGTVVLLFIARYLSVYDYGMFSSYKTIATFWLMFANMGYGDYILVSSKANEKEIQLKIGFFVISAIAWAILIGFGGIVSSIESKIIFLLVLLRAFFDGTFFGLMLPYFQATKKFNIISYVNLFYSIVTIFIAIISYIYHLSLIQFLIMSVILGLFNFIQVTFYSKVNYLLVIVYFKRICSKLDKSVFAYFGVGIGWYLYNQLPSLYSSTFVAKEQAALYFAAFTIANIIALLLAAQTQKMMPELINTTINKIKQVLKKNLKFILYINSVIFIFFLIFGKILLHLIYSKPYYINAYPILLILTLSNISIAIAAVYGAYITASGNQHIKIKMQIEAIIICVITLLLFHKFGIYAATLAYLLSATHIGIRYVIKTKQLLKQQETIENSGESVAKGNTQ